MQSHYRKQLIFTFENLENSQTAYLKLKQKIKLLNNDGNINDDMFKLYNNKFKKYINEDMNTSMAITVVYDVLKDSKLNGTTKIKLIESFDKVLSLDLLNDNNNVDEEFNNYVLEKIKLRNEAKLKKDYKLADIIREELLKEGVMLEDTRDGVVWRKI